MTGLAALRADAPLILRAQHQSVAVRSYVHIAGADFSA
jgi:hypothetical protein